EDDVELLSRDEHLDGFFQFDLQQVEREAHHGSGGIADVGDGSGVSADAHEGAARSLPATAAGDAEGGGRAVALAASDAAAGSLAERFAAADADDRIGRGVARSAHD